MFDNMNITKTFNILDNINGYDVPVCTFNAILNKNSGIAVNMNIMYPNLYNKNKDAILASYREFNGEVTALACTMGLAQIITNSPKVTVSSLSTEEYMPTLEQLAPINKEFKKMAIETFNQVITSLGDIQVNPVPTINMGYDSYQPQYR